MQSVHLVRVVSMEEIHLMDVMLRDGEIKIAEKTYARKRAKEWPHGAMGWHKRIGY